MITNPLIEAEAARLVDDAETRLLDLLLAWNDLTPAAVSTAVVDAERLMVVIWTANPLRCETWISIFALYLGCNRSDMRKLVKSRADYFLRTAAHADKFWNGVELTGDERERKEKHIRRIQSWMLN